MAAPMKFFRFSCLRNVFRCSGYETNCRTLQTSTIVNRRYVNQVDDGTIPESEFHQKQIELETREKFSVVEDADFTWVDKLMPKTMQPAMPSAGPFPTPSGWTPPTAKPSDHAYYVRRTPSHLLPVYLRETNNKLRKTTVVRYVDGDVWKLELDLRKLLTEKYGCEINTEVNEVTRVVKINGIYRDDVSQFLLEKGF